jgi:hypothetical protein
MLVLIWGAVVVAAFWIFFKQRYSILERYEVKHFKPIPLLGNMAGLVFRQEHFSDMVDKLYNAFPNER